MLCQTQKAQAADATLGKIASHLVNTIQLLETESSEALRDEIAGVVASKQSEICLVVGNKGAGKSTFIKRFFEDILPETSKVPALQPSSIGLISQAMRLRCNDGYQRN